MHNIRLMSVEEVAKAIDSSPAYIYNALSRGIFPIRAKKRGRRVLFLNSEVEEYINELPDYE